MKHKHPRDNELLEAEIEICTKFIELLVAENDYLKNENRRYWNILKYNIPLHRPESI